MEGKKVFLLEGLVPADLWNAAVVIIILFGVFVGIFKGVVMIRDEIKKHKKEKQLQSGDVTEQIAEKVTEKITSQIEEKFNDFNQKFDRKFEEIDKKLAADKETLDLHTTQLNAHEIRVNKLDGDSKALCHGMFALLSHEVNGNSIDKLKKAEGAMKNYLIDGIYKEDDWT